MEKKVKIGMKNGTEKFLADLTKEDLENVKLTEKSGTTNLTMKTEIVKETATHRIERRLFKWATMPKLAMYDLSIPKDLDQFVVEKGKIAVYEYAIGNFAIESDKLNNGIEAKGTDPVKNLDKIVLALVAKGVPQAEAEKAVASTKKMLLVSGFGK